jgi:hypothetical protein
MASLTWPGERDDTPVLPATYAHITISGDIGRQEHYLVII